MEKGHVVETAPRADLHRAVASLYPQADARDAAPGVSLRDLLPEDDAAAGARRPSEPRSPHASKPAPLLVVEKLVKEYPRKGCASRFKNCSARPAPEPEMFRAVDGISFTVTAARASAWSANPAAASPPPPPW
jgi:peptide/nickel transport system ATP-binding protein